MQSSKYYVYILSKKMNSVLYTGMTDNICRRVLEHKLKLRIGFTSHYNVDKLVYYEILESADKAIKREAKIKAGSRKKKIELINNFNKNWHDLYLEISSNKEIASSR